MNITKQFQAFSLHENAKGELILDADGAAYIKPHPTLHGKLFANPSELHQYVRDCEIRVAGAQARQEIVDPVDLELIDSLKGKTFIVLETIKYF